MSDKNPFEVLHLDPKLVRRLPEEKLDQLIKGVGRTLLTITHPDHGGNAEHFKAVNEAMGFLDRAANPDGFRRWKEKFTKERRTAGAQQAQAIAASTAALEAARDKIAELIGRAGDLSHGFALSMLDIVKHASLGNGTFFHPGAAFFNLEVRTDGSMLRSTLKKQREAESGRKYWGTIPKPAVGGIGDIVRMLEPQNYGRREIGPSYRFESSGGIGRTVSAHSRSTVTVEPSYRINRAEFRKFLAHASHDIAQDALLISADENRNLYLEGLICKVESLP